MYEFSSKIFVLSRHFILGGGDHLSLEWSCISVNMVYCESSKLPTCTCCLVVLLVKTCTCRMFTTFII